MHSQFTPKEELWSLQDSGDTCDVITTHPYSSPSYKTDRELMNTIKPIIHPSAQTVYSADIAGKPCFIEETGTFGQMYGNEEMNAKYMEGAIYTAWAHNCLGYLWWIGFDQGSLSYHPFGYNNRTSNYGLFREDRTIKPVGKVIKEYNEFVKKFGNLPERITDAVCIVTPGQNTWEAAGAAFILAKQARMDLHFAYSLDKLPDAEAYFIPSIQSANAFGIEYITELMKKVENGATLYVSLGNGFPRNLNTDFGFELVSRKSTNYVDKFFIDGCELDIRSNVIYDVVLKNAESLAKNKDGKDVFLKSSYGKGTIFTLMYPMETYLYNEMDVFSEKEHYRIYDKIRESLKSPKVVSCENRMIGITEHPINDTERFVIASNYGKDASISFKLEDGWKFDKAYLGDFSAELDCTLQNVKTVAFKIVK